MPTPLTGGETKCVFWDLKSPFDDLFYTDYCYIVIYLYSKLFYSITLFVG